MRTPSSADCWICGLSSTFLPPFALKPKHQKSTAELGTTQSSLVPGSPFPVRVRSPGFSPSGTGLTASCRHSSSSMPEKGCGDSPPACLGPPFRHLSPQAFECSGLSSIHLKRATQPLDEAAIVAEKTVQCGLNGMAQSGISRAIWITRARTRFRQPSLAVLASSIKSFTS